MPQDRRFPVATQKEPGGLLRMERIDYREVFESQKNSRTRTLVGTALLLLKWNGLRHWRGSGRGSGRGSWETGLRTKWSLPPEIRKPPWSP